MPNGFWYAGGETHTFHESIPASAFSKGDLLLFDGSGSSLSRVPFAAAAGLSANDIVGVALSDSNDSIDDRVTYLRPGSDTIFWASLASVDATALEPGTDSDIDFDVAEGRYHLDPSSTATVRAVIVQGNTGVGAVDQSVQSKVLCKLIYHAGNIDIS